MGLARWDDIYVDGVRATVDWRAMDVGCSVFVPCVNVSKVIRCVDKIFRKKRWSPRYAVVVENHILGVRIWRAA